MIIYIIMTISIAVLVFIDQLAKRLATAQLLDGKSITVINNVLELVYVKNKGAGFGILKNQRWLLITVTVLVIAAIVVYIVKDKRKHPVLITSAVFIIAGGVGNLIDRIFNGFVVDFFNLLFIDFPVFNFADTCVTIGAGLLIIYILFFDLTKSKGMVING